MELASRDAQPLFKGGERPALLLEGRRASSGSPLPPFLIAAERGASCQLGAQVFRAGEHQGSICESTMRRCTASLTGPGSSKARTGERCASCWSAAVSRAMGACRTARRRACARVLACDDGDARLARTKLGLGGLDAGDERGRLVAGAVGGGGRERGAAFQLLAAFARVIGLGGGADERRALLGDGLAGRKFVLGRGGGRTEASMSELPRSKAQSFVYSKPFSRESAGLGRMGGAWPPWVPAFAGTQSLPKSHRVCAPPSAHPSR